MTEITVTALLNEPDAKTKIGLRDRFLMIFLYDSGARISEGQEGTHERRNRKSAIAKIRRLRKGEVS